MLTYLEYLNAHLNLSSRIIIALVALFLFMQIIGELLEFKGKVVPEFLKVRKWFARKKKERENADKCNASIEEVKGMILEQGKRIDRLAEKVETLYDHDQKALECDLSVMDDRICWLIGECRRKGYTTAEDRRRIPRMHKAYQGRGGNNGEELEYRVFENLPTEEEYNRINSSNAK